MTTADVLLAEAIEYAEHHWQVGPLCHRDRDTRKTLHTRGKDPVGHLVRRGVLDFTDNVDTVTRWWSRTPWNIGVRVPESMIVIDIDPRHGGDETLATREAEHEPLPETLTTHTGGHPDGRHFYFRRPPGKLSASRLGPGIDLKTHAGYVVVAPSIHPDTGQPYARIEAPVAAPPAWLIELLTERPAPTAPRRLPTFTGPSIADQFSASTSWADILEPKGWTCPGRDYDADGAVWLHPTHTSSCSATIRHGCLFVYSPNTLFEQTAAGDRHGYTRFRAYAVLNHNGDMKAAARSLRGVS
jgi:hypothetical protein